MDEPMTPETALPRLRTLLAEAGFDELRPHLRPLWSAVRTWIATPVEGMDPEQDADLVAFEATLTLQGPGERARDPRFSLDFTRQFTHHDADGEYSGMEQILVTLDYAAHPDFEAITPMEGHWGTATQFWGRPVAGSAAWIARVERDRSFTTAQSHDPIGCSMSQGLL